ncbi:adenylate/guanylate cyclase domain-containing protein [Dissulfurirhabdus thermomarina]|uniref:Adenylate/guanylate cyclase domain-containing protein n=1 Tax=Dissulfurirhabdus thermomarina TaxID=1765737 RepID=A0A6N9TL06_DISTH|nr:adenylate/guanylate cyclase domain-containing protein [Dissulfurirhabdus thermomarina]NDY41915.1 adenylate/guanylate cyclase domain-containing protein [Dissulfurirhabdus thermomarina]NMX23922.1 adenylate/guanylate cyclase domain-containing protein [Dissulfurirhabdus thermomarina]
MPRREPPFDAPEPRHRKGRRTSLLLGAAITLATALLMCARPAVFELFERKSLDLRAQFRGEAAPPGNVTIIAIDDASLRRLGRFPWPRRRFARLLDVLAPLKPRLVVLDLIFSEPEADDPLLAEAMARSGNVLLAAYFTFGGPKGPDPPPRSSLRTAAVPVAGGVAPPEADSVTLPVPLLGRNALAVGHINLFPDPDGVVRWEPLLVGYRGRAYASLSLAAAARALELRGTDVTASGGRLHLGPDRRIPLDPFGRTLLHYYGGAGCFPTLSFADVLDGRFDPGLVRGRIVLVGATAVGVYDLRVTPFSPNMPGVEKHAHVISSLLEGRVLRRASFAVNLWILLATGLFFSWAAARSRAAGATAVALGGLAALLVSAAVLYSRLGLWVNVIYPGSNVVAVLIAVLAYKFAVEDRFARRIRRIFSAYVTERVVNELIRSPEMVKLGGLRREITILFCDLRDFTPFSEAHSPEEVVRRLNEFLTAMSEIVLAWDGTLDKFVGDQIVAFWNAPLPQPDHAVRAVACALEMERRLEDLQAGWRAAGKEPLRMGIGLNTGEALVGNIGAEGKKMEYTAIGDTVNLGARVEGLTRWFDVPVLVTRSTAEAVAPRLGRPPLEGVRFESLGEATVKGRRRPVEVFRPIRDQEPAPPSGAGNAAKSSSASPERAEEG